MKIHRVNMRDLCSSVPRYCDDLSHKPHSGFILMQNGEQIQFNLAEDIRFPFNFKQYQHTVALFMYLPKFGTWCASWHRCNEHNPGVAMKWSDSPDQCVDYLIDKVILEQREELDQQNDLDKNPLHALEHALRHHDWYHHYSDDYRVVAAGEHSSQRIRQLCGLVPAEHVERLWNLHCPWTQQA